MRCSHNLCDNRTQQLRDKVFAIDLDEPLVALILDICIIKF